MEKEKGKIHICCDCGIWSEEKPEKCICGCLCFTEEEIEVEEDE